MQPLPFDFAGKGYDARHEWPSVAFLLTHRELRTYIADMKESYTIYQVDAFTDKRFSGNPAGVVSDATGLSDVQMQKIARELNNSETAFIFPSRGNEEYDVEIRYFTPTVEVPLCGHATIAAHYVRAYENRLSSVQVIQKTKAGILPVDIVRNEDDYEIVMTQGEIGFGDFIEGRSRVTLLSALDIRNSDLDERCPIQIVSTGHAKVLIGVKARKKLNSLNPDMGLLKELSKSISCNGYFVFTFDASRADSGSKEILTYGRMFAPAIGINEDPVTGMANGPLGAYIVFHKLVDARGDRFCFRSCQGEAIGRPGVVSVDVGMQDGKPKIVKVGGSAVIVFKADISI